MSLTGYLKNKEIFKDPPELPKVGSGGQQLMRNNDGSVSWVDLIATASSAEEEAAAFANGSKIVIRIDLL